MSIAAAAPRPKPSLRGVSHAVAAVAAIPLALLLVAGAATPLAGLAAAVYGVSAVTLFTTSAVYHWPTWPPRLRGLLGRLDHAAIFLLIAGTYTPIGLRLGPGLGHGLLAVVWPLAAAGVAMALAWEDAPKPLRAAIYVVLGWVFLPALPALRAALGAGSLALLLGGGLLYTLGAVVFARRWPDPRPAHFGYHEVFHLLVIAAAACHYLLVARVVGAVG